MAITPLPTPPSRANPATFSDLTDAFLDALPVFATEANAAAEAMDLNDLSSTSVTSAVIGTGSKSITVDASKSYLPGMTVKIAQTSDVTNWMHGDVVSYNSGTGALVVTATYYEGSGTITDWTITYSSPLQNLKYYPDSTLANNGITGTGNTVKSIIDTIGTTNKATVVYRHNSGSEWTDYIFLTADDYTANTNIKFVFEQGARLSPATGIFLMLTGTQSGSVSILNTSFHINSSRC